MDIADIAQNQIEHDLLVAMQNHPSNPDAESLTHCLECGDEIPQARREAIPGCELCVDCKSIRERI